MKKELNLQDYKDFLDRARYDAGIEVQQENNALLKTVSVKDFCNKQIEKFDGENGNKTGCCLNFSMYLLSKYKGFLITCKDGKRGIHCAFAYLKANDLYVCDPARAKKENCEEIYFDIPLKGYYFENSEGLQIYTTNITMNEKSEESFFESYKKDLGIRSYECMEDVPKKALIEKLKEDFSL